MKQKAAKPYWEMSAQELAEATREFDQEFVGDTFRPMTRKERAEYNRIVRRGRPTIGKGAKTVAISVERERLKRIDAYAKAHGISRSELLLSGAETVMARGDKRSARRKAG